MLDIAVNGLPRELSVPCGLIENAFRRLTRLVQGMSQEELEYLGPGDNRNSTATLLNHMALTDLHYLHMIMGRPVPPELDAEFGPYQTADGTLPAVTGVELSVLLERYQRVIEMARSYLSSQDDAEAERTVRIPWWPQEATVRYVLWHMAGHSMLHQGQITRLRGSYKAARG